MSEIDEIAWFRSVVSGAARAPEAQFQLEVSLYLELFASKNVAYNGSGLTP